MSAPATAEFVPAREMPNGKLFYSPDGVYPFQADGLAECYVRTDPEAEGGVIPLWDTGIGKTVLALLASCYLYERGEIDQVVVICERNKVREWQADYQRFTGLSTLRYHDTGRQKRLVRHGVPHVFITVYETARDELMNKIRKEGTRGRGHAVDGPLMEQLGLRDKRVLWIFDEPIKLRNRGSGVYQAYEYVLKHLRRGPHHQRVIGLTASAMDTDRGQAFNIARLIAPSLMPTVTAFEEMFTYGRDEFGRYRYKPGIAAFDQIFQQIIIRKRKTDRDVIDQFPKQIEESDFVTMLKPHREFYNAVMCMLDPPEGQPETRDDDQIVADEQRLKRLLRMTAGHPASHLHVPNELSKMIVELVGEDGLRAIPSSKTARLIEKLTPLVKGQGAQVILFEFFTSVIKEVARELRDAGFTVTEYHGGLAEHLRERNKKAFLAGEFEILFCSDAGARGINLPVAQYCTEYSSSTTFSNRTQRINRNNRIDSKLPSTTATTMVLEATVEEEIYARAIDRNAAQDDLYGDREDGTRFVSAEQRRAILGAYHKRRTQRSPRKDQAA